MDFPVFDQWFSINVMPKLSGKVYLGEHLLVLPSEIACIGRNSPEIDTNQNSKCCSYQMFVVDTFNGNCFDTLNFKSVLARNYVRQWCLIQVHN